MKALKADTQVIDKELSKKDILLVMPAYINSIYYIPSDLLI